MWGYVEKIGKKREFVKMERSPKNRAEREGGSVAIGRGEEAVDKNALEPIEPAWLVGKRLFPEVSGLCGGGDRKSVMLWA